MFREDKKRAEALAEAISDARKIRKLSQEELARRVNVSTETIRKIEQCKTFSPGFFVVADVSKVLKINMKKLMKDVANG